MKNKLLDILAFLITGILIGVVVLVVVKFYPVLGMLFLCILGIVTLMISLTFMEWCVQRVINKFKQGNKKNCKCKKC